jgi:hypothetical protein
MIRCNSHARRVSFVLFVAVLALCFSPFSFASSRFVEKHLSAGPAGLKPLSLAHGDFDADGVQDLVAGYGSSSGGVLMFYKGTRDSLNPFFATRTVLIPVKPSFLGAGDFDADGRWDVVTAANGGTKLYFLTGDGHGGMGATRAIDVDGRITAMVTGEMNRADGLDDVVVATSGSKGARALVFEHPNGAMKATPEAIALPGKATALQLGRFGGTFNDLAATVGSESMIVRGRDRKLSLDAAEQKKAVAPVLQRNATLPNAAGRTPSEVVASLPMRLNKDSVPDQAQLTFAGQLKIMLSLPVNTYTVNDTGDGSDAALDGVCEVTASAGDCTLRAAIEEVNNGAGNDEIDFNIPGLGPVFTIAPATALPTITQQATIDASTQAAFTLGTSVKLDGSGGCGACDGLTNSVNGTVLIGRMEIASFFAGISTNNSMTIEDCDIYSNSEGVIASGLVTLGGTAAAQRNYIHSNSGDGVALLFGSSGSIIRGNYIGTNVAGNAASPNVVGIYVNSNTNVIGGTSAGAGNLISGNIADGIFTISANGNFVQGNLIGADVTGTIGLGNAGSGVAVGGASFLNTIGGTTSAARNVISGNGVDGVQIVDDSFDNLVQGNFIGTDSSGSSALGNTFRGVFIGGTFSTTGNAIGGTASGAGNTIAFNSDRGILINGCCGINTNSDPFRHNSIFSNGGLGIDLVAGGNDSQAAPNLAAVNSGGGSTTIDGLLSSNASTSYVLEFFSSPTCDPSGFGEGQTFIGSKLVTTDGAGNVVFSAVLPVTVAPGQNVTSTATDLTNNVNDTSEFSNCEAVPGTACPTITLSPASMPNGTVGTPYPTQTVTASGGTAPYAFTITAGSLPTGLNLNGSNGQVTGTPTAGGTFNFTVTATDQTGCQGSKAYTVTMTCPVITVTPPTLPGATVGTFYNQNISSLGGAGTVTYAQSAGTLPPGLSLAANGTLSGTPSSAGTFQFTVTATDQNGCQGSQIYSITVTCPVITLTPGTLPNGTGGTPYNQNVVASGGTAPYNYAVTFGAPPNGTNFNASGVLSGTPTTPGSFTFTVTATDFYGCQGSQSYTIIIACPAITLTPASLPNGQIGIAYSQIIGVLSGGTPPYTFTISSGAQPTGLILSAAGQLFGTPTVPGPYNFTVQATDLNGCVGSQAYLVTITSPLLLFDDFNDNVLDWTILKGVWTESGGTLNETGRGKALAPIPWNPSGVSICSICTINTDVMSSGGKVTIYGWYQKNGRVELIMDLGHDKWILKQFNLGAVVAVKKFPLLIDASTNYNVNISYNGSDFAVSIDGSLIMIMPAGAAPSGNVGFKVKDATANFDQITVSNP